MAADGRRNNLTVYLEGLRKTRNFLKADLHEGT
jgi:hypothetical protein